MSCHNFLLRILCLHNTVFAEQNSCTTGGSTTQHLHKKAFGQGNPYAARISQKTILYFFVFPSTMFRVPISTSGCGPVRCCCLEVPPGFSEPGSKNQVKVSGNPGNLVSGLQSCWGSTRSVLAAQPLHNNARPGARLHPSPFLQRS